MARRRPREQAARERRRVAKRQKRRQEAKIRATFDFDAYQSGLEEADAALDQEDWDGALEILEGLDVLFPDRQAVLERLTYCCSVLNRPAQGLNACTRLLDLNVNDEDALYAQAMWGASEVFPALAAQAAERFLQRHSQSERVGQVRDLRRALDKVLPGMLQTFPLEGAARLQLAAALDRLRLSLRDDVQAEALAKPWLERVPNFPPLWNNLAIARLFALRLEEARDAAERSLAIDPNNAHGLSKLARALALLGENERATECLGRLQAPGDGSEERRFLELETCVYLGAWEEADEAYRRWEQVRNKAHVDPLEAQAHHWGAATAARLGDMGRAKHLWQRALTIAPDHRLARENLDDLARPEPERNGPFAHDLSDWISPRWIDRFLGELARRAESEVDVEHRWQEFIGRQPALLRLAEIWLDRGSQPCRELAIQLLRYCPTPSGLQALRDFAGSRRGREQDRLQAMMVVNGRQDQEAPQPTRVFAEGQWRDIRCFGWEIVTESDKLLPEDCQELAQRANQAIHEQDGELAERLHRQLLARCPGEPSVQFNLAQSLRLLGRDEEADTMLEALRRQFPDYFFGRIDRAHALLEDPHAEEELREELDWLMDRPRLHVSEFASLVTLLVSKALRDDQPESARRWIAQLHEVAPEHPLLKQLESWLARTGGARRLIDAVAKLIPGKLKPRRKRKR